MLVIEDGATPAAMVLSALAAWAGGTSQSRLKPSLMRLTHRAAIGIQENVFGPIIIEKGEHLIAEFPSQFGF